MNFKFELRLLSVEEQRQKFIEFQKNGAPGKIRTPDPLIRSQVLYPAELPVRVPPVR